MVARDHSISLGLGRSWQYLQAIALAGPSIHPAFHASHFWMWPDANTPAIRADLASIGTERWLGSGWLASANAFVRHAVGVNLPSPASGKLIVGRPVWVQGENRARGVELSLRRIGAAWSTSVGYSLGESVIEVGDQVFPSAADRRHAFDAMVGVRLWRELRLAAAYTAMSGAPFTRAYVKTRQHCTSFGFGCSSPDGSYVDEHNAERTPAYASLDGSLQWSRTFGPIGVTSYLQVRNILARDNATTYGGSRPVGATRTVRPLNTDFALVFEDHFEPGLPRLPLAGLRITF
jgi:hypothetical protein